MPRDADDQFYIPHQLSEMHFNIALVSLTLLSALLYSTGSITQQADYEPVLTRVFFE